MDLPRLMVFFVQLTLIVRAFSRGGATDLLQYRNLHVLLHRSPWLLADTAQTRMYIMLAQLLPHLHHPHHLNEQSLHLRAHTNLTCPRLSTKRT